MKPTVKFKRLDDYSFVFVGWKPRFELLQTGWNMAIHLGLPYVEFHAWTDLGAASVRCDPCSSESAMFAYAQAVRRDLENAVLRGPR